jgi:chromosome segregation protein
MPWTSCGPKADPWGVSASFRRRKREDGSVTDIPEVAVGATWRCVDLHLHTPGVRSFELPPGIDVHEAGDRERLVREYVQKLVDADIQIAVITDYQGVRQPWFSLIREQAKVAGITVLPGAEMSIAEGKGLHLLLACSPDVDPLRIAEVIRYQGRSPDPLYADSVRGGHEELVLRGSLNDTLADVRERLGCAVIAAHASSTKGLFKAITVPVAAELIRSDLIDAVDQCESAMEKLRGTGLITPEDLDSLACTLSSDPHKLDEIGTKRLPDGRRSLTWIKLSTVHADALKLALHDPRTRVLTRPPEPVRHSRIRSMEVEGGFLDGLTLRFSDDLTTLIGGRGAGKSAILETLRYGLGAEPYSDQSERMSLIGHALGSGGRVRLVTERSGSEEQRYEVTRVFGQQPRVTSLSTGAIVDVPPLELFGPRGSPVILLQREIQAVARDDGFRLRLLDEIIGDDARQADAIVRRTLDELRRNGREIDELERQVSRREEYTDRLNRLDAEIGYYQQQGVAEKLDRHSKLGSDGARLETAARRAEEALSRHQDETALIIDSLSAAANELGATESEHASMLRELAANIEGVRDNAKTAMETVKAQLAGLREHVASALAMWPELILGIEDDLRRIQQDLGSGPIVAKRYVDAVSERTALKPIVDSMTRLDEDRERSRDMRDALLRQLQDQRRRGFKLRQLASETVNTVLDGRLRMEVTYLGDTADFERRLSSLFKGSRLTVDTVNTIASTPGVDGFELATAVRQGAATVARRFQISETMAHRLVSWLADDQERMRQLEVLVPDDRVAVALVIDGTPRDLAELSSGQKATALLLLLFAQGDRPLVLDQPEDDLDNRFVYEDVVTLLRTEKGVTDPSRRRQIIVATHNANIPVNGDAELVLSLADEGDRCQVRTRSSIDDAAVRREIRTVLEGGAEAFRRRAQKYGGIDDA